MAMYLKQVPAFTIMLQGRWRSDAFLWYIRKQVKDFSQSVSAAMISNETYAFYMVQDCLTNGQDKNRHTLINNQSLT